MKIYDLSLDIESGMPTCGTSWHQSVEIEQLGYIETVGRNTQRIVLGSHSGTHMDAPYHFIREGITMESLDVNLMWGKITAIDFRHKRRGDVVTVEDVKNIVVKERLLFTFGWYHMWKTDMYYKNFPYFQPSAVEYLLERGMKVMAMDTPSPDDGSSIMVKGECDSPCHLALLKQGAIVIEYLTNTDVLVDGKEYEFVSLPLKIKGSDGSPARVLIKEIE